MSKYKEMWLQLKETLLDQVKAAEKNKTDTFLAFDAEYAKKILLLMDRKEVSVNFGIREE